MNKQETIQVITLLAGNYDSIAKKDKTQKPHQETNVWVSKKENLLPPVSNLPNCNGSIYNLHKLGAKEITIAAIKPTIVPKRCTTN